MNLIATASVTIAAHVAKVWDALVNPEVIKRYMFGATVISTWKVGDPIVWRGDWKGKPYEDKGVVLEVVAPRRLRVSHFSPLSGKPDTPENYHTLTYELSEQGPQTIVRLAQEEKCDIIAMGTHGRTRLRRLLTGSVAEEVLRHAPCPVLALRTPKPSTRQAPTQTMAKPR